MRTHKWSRTQQNKKKEEKGKLHRSKPSKKSFFYWMRLQSSHALSYYYTLPSNNKITFQAKEYNNNVSHATTHHSAVKKRTRKRQSEAIVRGEMKHGKQEQANQDIYEGRDMQKVIKEATINSWEPIYLPTTLPHLSQYIFSFQATKMILHARISCMFT